ncbi:MAG: hypothetical protein ABSD76_16105 [Terriglobales bacterium]|jgi:hypothetical protein
MSTVPIDKSEFAASAGPEAQSAHGQNDIPLSVGRQFTLVSTLAAYSAMLLVGITHHEPWADEAQAWVLSRDLGYRYLVFHQLAYEGHPPFWATILWIANHWFHLPYQSLGWIAGLCALAGCWVFCRYSPFPIFVRVLFPFTYFMAFQYAIVARPYVLLPLCVFAAAHFFADAERHPWRFVAALSASALLCAPGVIFAAGVVAARVWYTFRKWNDIPVQAKKRLIGAAIVFCVVILFVALVTYPPADRTNPRIDRPANVRYFGVGIVPNVISVAFLGSPIPSMALLVVVGAWCAYRRRFLPFVLPTVLLLAFFIKVYGSQWHCGALTLIAVAALWIAWPHKEKERESSNLKLQSALKALVFVALASLFAVQIYWTARTLSMDYVGAYSGSLDAANFLHAVSADASTTCGFGFNSVAIQPYFHESIFKNWPKGESFWRFEEGNRVNESCHSAKWVVVPNCCTFDSAKQPFYQNDRLLRSLGYVPVHISRGLMFFEGAEAEPTDFVIYNLPAD